MTTMIIQRKLTNQSCREMMDLTNELIKSSKIPEMELLFHGTINKIFSERDLETSRESALYETNPVKLIPQIIGGLALVTVSLCKSGFSQITQDKFTQLKDRVDRFKASIRTEVGELSFDNDEFAYGASHFKVMNALIEENLNENTQGSGWKSIGLTSVVLSIVGLFSGIIWIGAASAAVACVAGAILFNHKHAIVISKQSLINQLVKSNSSLKMTIDRNDEINQYRESYKLF